MTDDDDMTRPPKDFMQWPQEKRDQWLDARDRWFQRQQFNTVPGVRREGLDLILISPASSCADPASPFVLTNRAAKELIERLTELVSPS